MKNMERSQKKKKKARPLVMIVDDNRRRGEGLAKRLRKEGFSITCCLNPRGALGIIRQKRPDVVIVEVIMPRVSGFEIAASMAADRRLSSIPVLFTTDIQNSQGGNHDYFARPFRMTSLISALRKKTSKAS